MLGNMEVPSDLNKGTVNGSIGKAASLWTEKQID